MCIIIKICLSIGSIHIGCISITCGKLPCSRAIRNASYGPYIPNENNNAGYIEDVKLTVDECQYN